MKDYFGKEAGRLADKKLWLLDMDGTIYEGERLFEGTMPFLKMIKESGGKYMFLTNNSSKSVEDYVKKVNRMGIDADRNDFFTSSQATVLYLKEYCPNRKVYVQGTKSLVKELRDSGIDVTEEVDKSATVVLVGFDTELTFEKLSKTCMMLRREVKYIATNPDFVCPVEGGFVPDCGSMCIGLAYATGKEPFVIGKPAPTMIDIVRHKFGIKKEETVFVGDRLYTDIASGNNAGVDTICVLSGEATLEDLKKGEFPPTWVFEDVGVVADLILKSRNDNR